MAINIIDILEPADDSFKVVHARDVEYSDTIKEDGQNVTISMDLQAKIEQLEGILKAEPELRYPAGYNPKQYYAKNEIPVLEFTLTTSAIGKCTITITKNNAPYKTLRANPGSFSIELDPVKESGRFIYKVSATDALGRAPNDLSFEFIYGGLELESNFDYVLKNTVYSVGMNTLEIPYKIFYAETGLTRNLEVKITQIKENSSTVVYNNTFNSGTGNIENTLQIDFNFAQSGKYKLEITGKLNQPEGVVLKSETLTYNFSVLKVPSIAADIIEYTNGTIDSSTSISLIYRIVTNMGEYQDANELKAILQIYKVEEEQRTEVKKIEVDNITSGQENVWSIGRLINPGEYVIKISGRPASGVMPSNIYDEFIELKLDIIASSSSGGNYVDHDGSIGNLVAYFSAEDMDNNMAQPNRWVASNNSDYFIDLYGLNYSTNGWQQADDDNLKCLSFTGDSYGIMKHKVQGQEKEFAPMSLINDTSKGQTLELVFKSKCIGEILADVITCRNDYASAQTGGYTLRYDEAKITNTKGEVTSRSLSENEWTHITFVINRDLKVMGTNITNSNLDDLNPTATMRIYINGCLSACQVVKDWSFFDSNNDAAQALPLLLNARYGANLTPSNFGVSDIKLLRLYNSPLSSSEVLGNYINSIRLPETQRKVSEKNQPETADVPVIYFVRNKIPYEGSKSSKAKSFEALHAITKKKSDVANEPTSKNSWINCTMWYKYKQENGAEDIISYKDVDVYLQGTSSLTYPVKNYQIKMFNPLETEGKKSHGSKFPFIPPNCTEEKGWYEQSASNVYTLKCDYMEQSHKNNTGTATFYENMMNEIQTNANEFKNTIFTEDDLDYIVDTDNTDISSLPKQIEIDGVKPYRDAINGFPVIVYYNDNNYEIKQGEETVEIDCNSSDEYLGTDYNIFAGTYMFNVDKEGTQLGFEIDLPEDAQLEDITYIDADGNTQTLEGITYDKYPCISLEGTSNTSFAAAGAFYTLEEYNQANVDPDADIDPSTGKPIVKETFDNYYDYIEATLEPRYSYADENLKDILEEKYGEDKAEEIIRSLTFERIKETIEWVSSSSNNKTKFRSEFGNYFSLTYCLIYYLQMQVFAQVDNAGKNAMFDSWGGKWYPRPYDMDTQMGLNNSGVDEILTSVEINSSMSNEKITGNFANNIEITSGLPHNGEKYDPNSHLRFKQYNTKSSKLWNSFAEYFAEEIQATYHYLRSKKIYDSEEIFKHVEDLTTNVIGERFYNMDASSKYLNTMKITNLGVDTAYLYACQGNRSGRYKQFLKERLIYLDTKFNYYPNIQQLGNPEYSNTEMTFRSDVPSGTGGKVAYLGVQVYSPQYITVSAGTDYTVTAYVDQNSKYSLNGITYEGVLLKLHFEGDNKDWTLRGAGNIKELTHIQNLHLTVCKIGEATKLTNLQIINSERLNELSLSNNTYLRKLDLEGNKALVQAITLTNCPNLKELNLSNSAITGVNLPSGAPINTLNLSNTDIGSLVLENLYSLANYDANKQTGLNITECKKISSLEIRNTPLISSLETSGLLDLRSLKINQCHGLINLNLTSNRLNTLELTNCNNLTTLTLDGSTGNILQNLNLSTLYNLQNLSLVQANGPANTGIRILLPYYLTPEESQKPEAEQQRWNKLKKLNAKESNLIEIYYSGTSSIDDPIIDLEPLDQLNSCSFNACKSAKKIHNFKYTGSLSSMFAYSSNLTEVTGTILDCSSLSSTFYQCTKLNNLNLAFKRTKEDGSLEEGSNATAFTYTFYSCSAITKNQVEKIITQNKDITDATGAFLGCRQITSPPNISGWENLTNASRLLENTGITSINSNYFSGLTNITNLSRAFSGCTGLTKINNTNNIPLLKHLTKLTNVRDLFYGCSNLGTFFINNSFDILPSSVQYVDSMFYGCAKLVIPENALLYDFFKSATDEEGNALPNNLLSAELTFKGVTGLKDSNLGSNFLKDNTQLTSIAGMFSGCTGIETVPSQLTDNANNSLTNLGGLFENCTNLTGKIPRSFFNCLTKITSLGMGRSKNQISSTTYYYRYLGAFANTKITELDQNLFSSLTELKNISFLFAKGALNTELNNNTEVSFTPSSHGNIAFDSSLTKFGGNNIGFIPITLFTNNTKLETAAGCFAGNLGITSFDEGETGLFSSSANTLENLDGIFANCSTSDGITGITFSMHNKLFKGLKKLKTAQFAFANCTSMQGSINADLFTECENLANVQGMFYKCSKLGINDIDNEISIPNNLFDSCRNSLTNVSSMFAHCGFNGRIGVGTAPENGNYTNQGLLANCNNLFTAEAMFSNCKNLKGAIPFDMFYSNNDYNYLTNISKLFNGCYGLGLTYNAVGLNGANYQTIYGNTSQEYLIPINWISKCPNITDISYLFNNIAPAHHLDGTYKDSFVYKPNIINNSIEIQPNESRFKLAANTFDAQTQITNISYAFSGIYSLIGNLDNTFLQNSLTKLSKATGVFAYSIKLNSIANGSNAIFQYPQLSGQAVINPVLKDVARAFYNCISLSGSGPLINSLFQCSDSRNVVYNCPLNNLEHYNDIQKAQGDWNRSSMQYNFAKDIIIKYTVA